MKILIVEDCQVWSALLTAALKNHGTQTHTAETMREAVAFLDDHAPDCVILDLNLPDSPASDTVRRLAAHYNGPLVIVTGQDEQPQHPYVLSKNYSAKPEIIRASVNAAIQEGQTRTMIRRMHPRAMFSKTLEKGTKLMAAGLTAATA